MGKINVCQACCNIEHGVKSRISVEHTCGKSPIEINDLIKESNRTRYPHIFGKPIDEPKENKTSRKI